MSYHPYSVDTCEQFTFIPQDCFTGTGAIITYEENLLISTPVSWTVEHIEIEEYLGKFAEKLKVKHQFYTTAIAANLIFGFFTNQISKECVGFFLTT